MNEYRQGPAFIAHFFYTTQTAIQKFIRKIKYLL